VSSRSFLCVHHQVTLMHIISEYLFQSAQRWPDAVALVCGNQRITYSALAKRASSLAGYLVSEGLQKGDRVAIFLDNSAEAVAGIFGTLSAGGCIVVVNPVAPPERLAFIVRNCEAKFLVASALRLEVLQKGLELCMPHQPALILAGKPGLLEPVTPRAASMEAICEAGISDPMVPVEPTDLAAIIYTSGSMGVPKGVTFLHGNIDAGVDSIAEYLEHTEHDIILSVLPLASSYGLLQILVPFWTGGRVVLEKGMAYPYDFIRWIKEHRVTGFAGNPTLFAILLRLAGIESEDLSSLRYITNAAAALPVTFAPQLLKIFPTAKLYLMHGLTECLRTSYLPPAEVLTRTSSIGTGMRNVELWIQDANGRRLGCGETGELMVHGPTVMQGYWNNPEGTSQALVPGKTPWDNTLRTNDLFRLDHDGYFHFVARSDELIKSRGEKVSPVEVEDALYNMEEVLEVRVLGVPDPMLGFAVKAEIVVKEGHLLTAQQVKAYCRKHLEDYKVPQMIEFVSAIPRTQAGKITRKVT
jgi:long-chain acyl-CoA synthetase